MLPEGVTPEDAKKFKEAFDRGVNDASSSPTLDEALAKAAKSVPELDSKGPDGAGYWFGFTHTVGEAVVQGAMQRHMVESLVKNLTSDEDGGKGADAVRQALADLLQGNGQGGPRPPEAKAEDDRPMPGQYL